MVLLIDNYDSFVYNLARYVRLLGISTRVVRNDAIAISEIERLAPRAIMISPGPCTPSEAGCSLDVVRRLSGRIPILGICLGHQVIAQAFGGSVIRATQPQHGRTSKIFHAGQGLFQAIPSPMNAGRYHSLIVCKETLPGCFQITAETQDGTIMALEHRQYPVTGLQFHPESILTEHGSQLLRNFLCKLEAAPSNNEIRLAANGLRPQLQQ